MTVTINGTTGVAGVDGTASTPAIQGNDTNTGIFFPAADTIAFAEGGAEVARFDSSGRLGVGVTAPTAQLATLGNVNIGNNSSTNPNSYLRFGATQFGASDIRPVDEGSHKCGLSFYTDGTADTTINPTERMRITGAGDVLIGEDAFTWPPVAISYQFNDTDSNAWFVIAGNSNTADNTFGPTIYNLNASFNGTRFYVRVDGGVANYSANNQNLSDERVKNNIELSGNYLDKICAIPVKLFNYKDEPEGTQKSLGVIAQDVEAVAPELVNAKDGFGEEDVNDEPLKMIYQTDLQYALMKCIQEQQAIITDLKARIETLENK